MKHIELFHAFYKARMAPEMNQYEQAGKLESVHKEHARGQAAGYIKR